MYTAPLIQKMLDNMVSILSSCVHFTVWAVNLSAVSFIDRNLTSISYSNAPQHLTIDQLPALKINRKLVVVLLC